jgi:predicted amidophosphoribosyltransferase
MSPSASVCNIVITCKMYRDERGQARLFWVCEKCGLEWRDDEVRCPRCEHMRAKVELYSARRVAGALYPLFETIERVHDLRIAPLWQTALQTARRVLREEARAEAMSRNARNRGGDLK